MQNAVKSFHAVPHVLKSHSARGGFCHTLRSFHAAVIGDQKLIKGRMLPDGDLNLSGVAVFYNIVHGFLCD